MKIFLNASIAAMVAAGIFGVYDFSNDVKHGNFIVYQNGDEDNLTSFASERKADAVKFTNVIDAVEDSFVPNTQKRKAKVIKEEYFSRGEPMIVEDVENPEIIVPTAAAEVVKEEENVVVKSTTAKKSEKRKFNYKLYSRGRPPKITEEEVELVLTDSTKKVE